MTTQELINRILEDTYTTKKLALRASLLKEYLVASFFSSLEEFKSKQTGNEMTWIESLEPEFFQSFTKENVYQIFKEIEKYLDTLKPLIVYLPLVVSSTEIVDIGKKLRSQYNQHFLFDVKYDPNLIAGCALVWNGVYKDYSLRSSIEARKTEILGSFREYITKK